MKANLVTLLALVGSGAVSSVSITRDHEQSGQSMIEKMAARAHASMIQSQSLSPGRADAGAGTPRSSVEYKKYLKKERSKIDSDNYKYDEWKKTDKQRAKLAQATKKVVTKSLLDGAAGSNTPVIQFSDDYDHEGYDRSSVEKLKSKIGLVRSQQAAEDKPYCQMGDYVQLHWTAKTDDDGEEENSKTYKYGNSKLFRLGHYEVSKCWDIAVMQMKAGEKGSVTCPSVHDTSKGTNEVNIHHHKGHGWHKSQNDVIYNVEVKSCSRLLEYPKAGIATPHKKCMYIVSADVRIEDKPLALTPDTVETQKAGDPVKTYAAKMVKYNPADRTQKWWWDKSDNALHSYGPFDDHVLIERKGGLTIIDHEQSQKTNKGKYTKTEMEYNKDSKQWTNSVTGKSIVLNVEDPTKVSFDSLTTNVSQAKWDLVTCASLGQAHSVLSPVDPVAGKAPAQPMTISVGGKSLSVTADGVPLDTEAAAEPAPAPFNPGLSISVGP